MDSNKFDKLLNRYLDGDANETENAIVNAWYKSYEPNEDVVKYNDDAKKTVKKRLTSYIKPLENNKPKRIKLFAVAASILFCLILVTLFNHQLKKRIHFETYSAYETRTGQLKKITLPDSSVVWINASTKIKVPTLSGKLREVYLEEGEAFFNVTKNPEKPFIVHTGKLNIKVLGTSFNVKSYSAISQQKIQVSTGLVEISDEQQVLAQLRPGQQLSYNKVNRNTNIDTINIQHIVWTNGSIYLDQVSFSELALTLKNTYGLHLKSGSKAVNNYHFTLKIKHNQPIDSILKAISMIHNTHYRKEANDIIIY